MREDHRKRFQQDAHAKFLTIIERDRAESRHRRSDEPKHYDVSAADGPQRPQERAKTIENDFSRMHTQNFERESHGIAQSTATDDPIAREDHRKRFQPDTHAKFQTIIERDRAKNRHRRSDKPKHYDESAADGRQRPQERAKTIENDFSRINTQSFK